MSTAGGEEEQSEFSILGWTALGKEVLNMTQKKEVSGSDCSDNNEESRDSRLDVESEADTGQLGDGEDESIDSRLESENEIDDKILDSDSLDKMDEEMKDDCEDEIGNVTFGDDYSKVISGNDLRKEIKSESGEQDKTEADAMDSQDIPDTHEDFVVKEITDKECARVGVTEISQETPENEKKDFTLIKDKHTLFIKNDFYNKDNDKKLIDVKRVKREVSDVKMDEGADSVNETEVSGYGETSGTDSSSNFPDSDFSDISRKRKRGHKSSSRLDSLVKKIMKRSTDAPKDTQTESSKTRDNVSSTPSEENSQSSIPGGTVDTETSRLFQIQAFADGQISCEDESSQVESEGESEAYFVSHLNVMETGGSSESEGPKKAEVDDDYLPTEGTDEADEEVEEEFKSDSASNYSDDDYTALARKKKKKKAKPFLCGVCNKDFISAKMLEGHMKCHIDPKSLTCNVCGKLFDFPYKLKNHAKVHNKPFECDICGRTFTDRGGFTRHRNTHTVMEKFPCKTCGEEFDSEKDLTKHKSSHDTPVEKMKCHTCGKEFTSKDTLSEHLKTHAAFLYECDMCDKTFTEDEEYTAHLRAHDEEDDEEIFKCKTCNQVLASQKGLTQHEKLHATHTYICETCSRTFTDDKIYAMHLKTHKYEDVITWKCNKCKLEFMLKEELRDHLKKHAAHSFTCDQCNRVFTDEILYAAHLRGHKTQDDIRWKCNKCKLEFLKKEELKEHLKIHIKPAFECNTCSESFAYESDYNAHLKQHYSEELLNCSFCPQKFVTNVGLTRHLKTHVKDLMICETCGETFKDRHKYAKHVRFHKAMLRCKKCGHMAASKSDLNTHMQTHVQHIYVCETCCETFSSDTVYAEHLKTHETTAQEEEDDVPVIIIS